jgi:putative Mg2+ transporter-C (MgtC) family protein
MVIQGHFHFDSPEQMSLTADAARRLLMACAMGGMVGLEREFRHKDSGLRTNLLICVGAALFTLLSAVLAGPGSPNRGQVASNIVQGIGFLGAGLILHTRSRVLGLTSAATVWVVASIGMACGAGLYAVALISTLLLLIALVGIGMVEGKLGWKRFPKLYEVRAEVGVLVSRDLVGPEHAKAVAEAREAARHRMFTAVLKVLDGMGQRLHVRERDNVAGMERIAFSVTGNRSEHLRMLQELRSSDATDQVVVFDDPEDD